MSLKDKTITYIKKYEILILVAEIVGIAAAIIYICCNQAVHWDEAYTYRIVTQFSVVDMLKETAADIHPPLYYLLVKVCTLFWGSHLMVFKLFSVLCTVATMVLGITLVRKRWGGQVAFLFIMVCGLGTQFIYFAVDVRMYALEMFFVTACGLLAYEIFLENRRRDWILLTISAMGGAYTHYFSIVPLAIIYGFLFIWGIVKNRKAIRRFVVCCICTVLGYLPWLFVLLQSFEAQGTTGEVNLLLFDLKGLVEWAFSNNIEFSAYMPVILYLLALVSLVVRRKQISFEKLLFQIMCAANWAISYLLCLVIASMSEHFWDDRYIYGSLGLFWLFLFISIIEQKKETFYGLAVWLTIMVLSSFTIQKSRELGTIEYVNAAHEVLKQVEDEETLLYNFPTYNVLWEYHVPGKEFIYIDDIDLNEIEGNYIYMIAWGGRDFPQSVYDEFHIAIDDCGAMRFEEGIAGVRLYKVRFQKK